MINVESNCDDKTLKSQEIREGTGTAGLERGQEKKKKKKEKKRAARESLWREGDKFRE